ncbi:MAG TPA: hypothetical protein VLA39_05510 [Marinobacterium sp.]|nr:hypothetical protein [Marinobacterium sp.]
MAVINAAGRYGLAEYFRIEIEKISNPRASADTSCYLSSMLERFARSEIYFSADQDGIGLRPLALIYEEAYNTSSENERRLLLRQLGDQALFTGAMFPEFYARKGIARDYFIGMGGGAYSYLADRVPSLQEAFEELSQRFAQMLELVARVLRRYRKLDAQELMALYDRWRQTRDPALGRQLVELGVVLD